MYPQRPYLVLTHAEEVSGGGQVQRLFKHPFAITRHLDRPCADVDQVWRLRKWRVRSSMRCRRKARSCSGRARSCAACACSASRSSWMSSALSLATMSSCPASAPNAAIAARWSARARSISTSSSRWTASLVSNISMASAASAARSSAAFASAMICSGLASVCAIVRNVMSSTIVAEMLCMAQGWLGLLPRCTQR